MNSKMSLLLRGMNTQFIKNDILYDIKNTKGTVSFGGSTTKRKAIWHCGRDTCPTSRFYYQF